MIYSRLRAARGLLDSALSVIREGEGIRFWEDGAPGRLQPLEVYSETFPGSEATSVIRKGEGYREIPKGEFEEGVGITTAGRVWEKIGKTGTVKKPSLVMMAGVPLSGKSTLAREIAKCATEPAVLVVNDEIRKYVVSEAGDTEPKFTDSEGTRTYNVSRELIRMGLSNHCHVIFDATNITEGSRKPTYEVARQKSAKFEVVIVTASADAAKERYIGAGQERREAYDKLGRKTVEGVAAGIRSVAVESDRDARELLKRIGPGLLIKTDA